MFFEFLTEKEKWCIKYTTMCLDLSDIIKNRNKETMPSCFWKREHDGFFLHRKGKRRSRDWWGAARILMDMIHYVSKWHIHLKLLCDNAINHANKTNENKAETTKLNRMHKYNWHFNDKIVKLKHRKRKFGQRDP